MKLKEGFITHETDLEQFMVPAGNTNFNGVVKCNKTAAYIVDCLKTETTETEIVQKMLVRYEAPKESVSEDVKNILNTLRSINALDE